MPDQTSHKVITFLEYLPSGAMVITNSYDIVFSNIMIRRLLKLANHSILDTLKEFII